jgi:hypothetical protein
MAVYMAEHEAAELRMMPIDELATYAEDRLRELNYLATFVGSGRISRHSRAFTLLFEALGRAEEQYSEAQTVWRERLPEDARFDKPVIFRRPNRQRGGSDDGSE